MKKSLAAILAVLSVVCTFTACGNETMENSESSSVSESSESSDSSESSAADTTEDESSDEVKVEKTTKKITEEDLEKTSKASKEDIEKKIEEAKENIKKQTEKLESEISKAESDASNAEYINIMEEFCKSVKAQDVDKLLKCCLPDTSYNSMKAVGALDAMGEEMGVEDMDMPADIDRDDIKVISVREADEEEKTSSEQIYSLLDAMYGMMADVGITYDMISGDAEMPDDVFEAYVERIGELDFTSPEDIPITVEFDEYVFVTYSLAGEEEEIALFRVKGEGVKLDSIQASGVDFDDMF